MKENYILQWFLALLRKERTETTVDKERKASLYESVCRKLKS